MPSVVTHATYCSRFCNAVSGSCCGLLLFLAAFPLLFWNEGNYVKQAAALDELAMITVDEHFPSSISKENNLKPICIRGPLTYSKEIIDTEYGIHAYGLRLTRKPETYQYIEHSTTHTQKTAGGGETTITTFSYTKDWEQRLHPQLADLAYRNRNPTQWKIHPESFYGSAKLGVFDLPSTVLANAGKEEEIHFLDATHSFVGKALADSSSDKQTKLLTGSITIGKALMNTDSQSSTDKSKALTSSLSALVTNLRYDGKYVFTGNPHQPDIGDNRAKWTIVRPQSLTVLGKQTADGRIVPYTTSNQRDILLYAEGELTTNELLETAQSENTLQTWLLRFGGWICMFIGFLLMFQPAGIVFDIVPFVGSYISSMVTCGLTVVAFSSSLCLSLLVIAVAWFAYRPLFAVGLGLIIGVLMWLTSKLRSSAGEKKKD